MLVSPRRHPLASPPARGEHVSDVVSRDCVLAIARRHDVATRSTVHRRLGCLTLPGSNLLALVFKCARPSAAHYSPAHFAYKIYHRFRLGDTLDVPAASCHLMYAPNLETKPSKSSAHLVKAISLSRFAARAWLVEAVVAANGQSRWCWCSGSGPCAEASATMGVLLVIYPQCS